MFYFSPTPKKKKKINFKQRFFFLNFYFYFFIFGKKSKCLYPKYQKKKKKMNINLLSLVLILISTFALLSVVEANHIKHRGKFNNDRMIGFFCADNGEFSGMGELFYITQALQEPIFYYPDITECGNVTSGFLTGANGAQIPSLIVTTGISALNAAMCTTAIQYKFNLQKILYIGTSGWSQFVGGLDPSNNCQNGLPKENAFNALGSVCITNTAVSAECGICVHNNGMIHTSECSLPDCNSRTATSLFGPCTFTAPPSSQLQNEIAQIAKGITFPQMSSQLQQLSMKYWVAQGFTAYPAVPSVRSGNCLEFDMQQILASGPMDNLCREYTAQILSTPTNPLTANDVSCVNAMEGTGFMRALYGAGKGDKKQGSSSSTVQVAILRGASNWDMFPVRAVDWESSLQPPMPGKKWIQLVNYTSEENHAKLTQLGYQYAILTSNTIALEWVKTLQ